MTTESEIYRRSVRTREGLESEWLLRPTCLYAKVKDETEWIGRWYVLRKSYLRFILSGTFSEQQPGCFSFRSVYEE